VSFAFSFARCAYGCLCVHDCMWRVCKCVCERVVILVMPDGDGVGVGEREEMMSKGEVKNMIKGGR
jgi:hypothetical protein